MASESLGKDWGLSQEEALQAHGELVLGFVRCLPKLGPRSEIGPILAAVLLDPVHYFSRFLIVSVAISGNAAINSLMLFILWQRLSHEFQCSFQVSVHKYMIPLFWYTNG